MTMAWSNAPYELLLPLWRQWLAEDAQLTGQWPLLDRWLKRQLPFVKNHGKPTQRKKVQPLDLATQLMLSAAMFSAMRYLQLAAALEHSYRAQTLALDWSAWDSNWAAAEVHKISPTAFWYWVTLRNTTDAPAPGALRDAESRKAWFLRAQQSLAGSDNEGSDNEGADISLGQSQHVASELLWHGLRPQWWDLLQARAQVSEWSAQDLNGFVAMQSQSPPLWLRPQGEMTAEDLLPLLSGEGVDVVLDSEGLYALGGTGITQTSSYKNGWVEIQDRASQHIAACVAARQGDKVWDACAGAGGKSLAIAARMNNKGMVLATDLQSYKLDELKRRAKRAGLYNIRTFEWQGREALRLPAEAARQQGFDWVLVDAPCTSAGTWRRNPDARWRFNALDTSELLDLQKAILLSASKAVRPGGYLVYATCSWQVSENENQVDDFLACQPAFSLASRTLVGAPAWNADTMFVAVLKRAN